MVELAPHRPPIRGSLSPLHPRPHRLHPPDERGTQAARPPSRACCGARNCPRVAPFYPRCDHARSPPARPTRSAWKARATPAGWPASDGRRSRKSQEKAPCAPDAARRETVEEVLAVEDVSLGYGKRRRALGHGAANGNVVHDCSFTISRGETFALVGESGSGKSTIARAIAGLLPPMQGSIRFRGEAVPPLVKERSASTLRDIQYVFQNPDASLNPRRPGRHHPVPAARDVLRS